VAIEVIDIFMFGPGPQSQGGIARFGENARLAAPASVRVNSVSTYANRGFSRLLSFAKSLWIAATLRRSDSTLVHINISSQGSTVRKYLISRLLRFRRIPYVLHLHASSYPEWIKGVSSTNRKRVQAVFGQARGVIVLGSQSQRFVEDELGVGRDRIFVVPNGVPGPSEVPKRDPSASPTIAFAGELSDRKGVPELIVAAAQVSTDHAFRLRLAGGGDLTETQQQIDELDLSSTVELLGILNQEELNALLSESNIFVLPSHREGLPLALLEAMAHGCAVISTPVGNIGDLIDEGNDGLLVAPGSPEDLASAMSRLLDDPQLLRSLSTGARRKWEEGFSDSVMLAALEDVWRACLGLSGEAQRPSNT